jgi:tRNA modification GTPase
MSLTQAEAVMDVIAAEGEAALRQAEIAREGRLGREMQQASAELVSLLAAFAYWMDDAEEFPPELEHAALTAKLTQIRDHLVFLSANYDNGRMVREGIRTVFLGLPNAGKSSLMNLLCGSRRSIVTDIPGTTRDIVREYVKINEFTLILSDTAGIRESADEIEAIGVADAMHEAEQADLIFYVIDSTNNITEYDCELLKQLSGKRVLILWNKMDQSEVSAPELHFPVLMTNAHDVSTTEAIYHALQNMFADACFSGHPCVMNERQNQLVVQAISALTSVLTALKQDAPLDMLFFDLESAANNLKQIDGADVSESVLDEVFSRFCVGK